jgi:hypothetical protein
VLVGSAAVLSASLQPAAADPAVASALCCSVTCVLAAAAAAPLLPEQLTQHCAAWYASARVPSRVQVSGA